MKVKSAQSLIILIFLLVTAGNLSAVDYYESPMVPINPRFSAMGGNHVAVHDGFSSLFQNPAGFLRTEQEVSYAQLNFGFKGPIFTIADLVLAGAETEDIAEVLDGLYTGVDIGGPLAFGYVGKGLGLGIFSNLDTVIKSNNPLTAREIIMQDILLTGGYSFPILGGEEKSPKHRLDGGMLLKGGFRGKIMGGISVIELQSPSAGLLLDKPFYFTSLIGADLGLLYSYEGRWFFGMTGNDVFTPTLRSEYNNLDAFMAGETALEEEFGIVPFSLNTGGMYLMDLQNRNIFISEIKFLLDYEDALDFWLYPELATNPVLHVGIGAEVTMMQILDVRIGFAQGLPTAGIGLDLHYFTLNAAMFGTERSSEPGMSPVYNLQIGLEFVY